MPADHPLITAAAAESGLVQDTLRNEIVKRMPFTIGPTETLGDFAQSIGSTPLSVVNSTTGLLYFYDETDTTTADDGLTCLVDGLGHRYKVQESAAVGVSSVLAIASAPPGSPSLGDAYVIDVAPTGAWAANAKNIAVWTARGWVYASAAVGTTLLNQDTGLNIQYSAAGSWGEFAADIAAGAITPTMLEFPTGIIVETTENTPPGVPTTGKFWIVGSIPTGAFVGHAADLAYWTGSAWAFLDPADGWSAYNKQAGFEVYYTSGSWLGASGSDYQSFSTAGAATWTKPAKGTRAFVQVWGAGGSGSRAGSGDGGGGGGGGSYAEAWFDLADLASSVAITVGAGGVAATSDNQNGAIGGNSSFGAHLVAYGGGAGGNASTAGAGGGGGGTAGAGANASGASGGAGGAGVGSASAAGTGGNEPGGSSIWGGGGGAGSGSGSSPANGGDSVYGGGGGAKATEGGGTGGTGGLSRYGGGGGGGGADSGAGGAGGASTFGGNGGAGATGGGNGTAGAQPGGGGGGSESGNSGKGGDGRVRVTVV